MAERSRACPVAGFNGQRAGDEQALDHRAWSEHDLARENLCRRDPNDVAVWVRFGQAGLDVVVRADRERSCWSGETGGMGLLADYVGELRTGLEGMEGRAG